MLVQEILKCDGKQVKFLVNNTYINLENAVILYKRGYLDNVVLIKDQFFKTKSGFNRIKIKEVKSYVKRDESNLGQVRRPKSKSGRCNKGGSLSFKDSNRKSRCEKADKRGKSCSGVTTGNELREAQVSSSETLRHIRLRLKKLGCVQFELDNPKSFREDFNSAKSAQKNGACVDEHSLKDLSNMKLLRSENGFVAVESNGNINSVLRDVRKHKTSNFLRDLLLNAIANGGCKLDCFAITKDGANGGLAEMYSQYGFIPIVKDHFNRDFAPDNWNYERDGEPDVVFMYYCGDSIETVVKKSDNKKYKHYLDYDIPYITDLPQYIKPSEDYDWNTDKDNLTTYSQAMRYRDWVMEKAYKYK